MLDLQRVRAQRLERGRQLLLGIGERGQAFLCERALVLEVRPSAYELAFELRGARRIARQGAHAGAERDEHGAGTEDQSEQ